MLLISSKKPSNKQTLFVGLFLYFYIMPRSLKASERIPVSVILNLSAHVHGSKRETGLLSCALLSTYGAQVRTACVRLNIWDSVTFHLPFVGSILGLKRKFSFHISTKMLVSIKIFLFSNRNIYELSEVCGNLFFWGHISAFFS